MATTEGLEARAPGPTGEATAGGETELRAVVASRLGAGGPLLPSPVMEAGGLGALAGGLAGAAVAAAVNAVFRRPAWADPRLWVLLAVAVGAAGVASVAMRRWRGVPLFLPGATREAARLAPGTWVAVEGERRPWQRLAEVLEVEALGGPYDLVRVVLGNGSEITVAGSCRVPVGSLAPPPVLLSWPARSAEGIR